MTFESPELLALLVLVPLALIGLLGMARRRTRYAVRFTNLDLLANVAPRRPAWRRWVPPAVYLAAIAALVLALARPTMTVAVPREEATIILAMDVSGSMRATDVTPSRLAAAQAAAVSFIDQLPERFRVGLVTFATDAVLRVPPTTDRALLKTAIDGLRADGGTAIGDAIGQALEASAADTAATPTPVPTPSPSAGNGADDASPPLVATVLLSDGANTSGRLEPAEAANRAAAAGMPVYTIALGTQDGIVDVEDENGETQRVPVPPDTETLAEVAETTGARYFEAPTEADLKAIYDSVGSKVGTTEEQQEVTFAFAAGGLALVIVGAATAAFWFNRFP